jgi:hypothetical protein
MTSTVCASTHVTLPLALIMGGSELAAERTPLAWAVPRRCGSSTCAFSVETGSCSEDTRYDIEV